jgi:hypothetical protein
VIKAAGQANLNPWNVEEKQQIIQFIRETREQLDILKRQMPPQHAHVSNV